MDNKNRGIIYFANGERHLVRLVVSVYSLRAAGYSGPVAILWDGTYSEIMDRIAADSTLAVRVIRIPPDQFIQRKRHTAYAMKSSLWRFSPFETTLYIDADTTIDAERGAAGIDSLFGICETEAPGFVVTRFSDWVTTGNIMSSRIRQWMGVKCEGESVARMVAASLEEPHAAVNTGVMAWRRGAEFLGPWESVTQAGWRCSFVDELAVQILLREYDHTLVADRFNCSPIYGRGQAAAVVWHMHGNKHCERAPGGRGSQGHKLWWPIYSAAVAQGVAGVAGVGEWSPAGDKHLGAYLRRVDGLRLGT